MDMDTIKQIFGDRIKENVPLKNYTTVGIGGPAKFFFVAKSNEDLKQIVLICKKEDIKFFIMGDGSNLLISDEGLPCLVIKNEAKGITQQENTIIADGGTPLQQLVDYTIEHEFEGAQRLTGIPGTVAGSVYGNAGAYGQTVSDFLTEVVVFDGKNEITISKKDCGFSYRDSNFKVNQLIILKTCFQFPKGNKELLVKEAEETRAKRQAKYLPGIRCPGSFFKNVLENTVPKNILHILPERKDTYGKIPAWLFLEEVGAKGQRLGDIKIADFHANLFMNIGNGKASDFWQLAYIYAQKVKEKYGVQLEPEVQLVGLPPFFKEGS